jgi:carbonic anhydrase
MREEATMVRRREFLRRAVAAATAGAAVHADFIPALGGTVAAQSTLTPDEALRQLMAGNARFDANRLTSLDRDLQILRSHTVEKQEPFAAVLSCADSRVPVELVFDQTIGQLFVCRVAGNLVTPEIIASLEYGVAVLGTKVLLVLGHSACGAVKASMHADSVPGQISTLYQRLQPAVAKSGGDVNKAIALNADIQADLLRTSSPVLRDAIKAGNLKIESGVYDLATGKVTLHA